MKRIIAVLLISILALAGCVKKQEVVNPDEITNFKFIYLADAKDTNSRYRIIIRFSEKDPTVEVMEYSTDLVSKFNVTDVVNLKAYIDKLKNDPDLFRYEDNSGSATEILWHLQIDTVGMTYSTGAKSEYPVFWDELFDMLIEYSKAESKLDFGIGKENKKLSAVKKTYEDKADTHKVTMEYPELSGTDKADAINQTLQEVVFNLPVLDLNSYPEDKFVTINGKYEFVRKTGGVLSIKFNCSYAVKDTPNAEDVCYGITVNTETGELISLSELISYEDIVNHLQNGEYGAVYGVFTLMEKEEIIKEFNEVIIESEYDTYMNNFYEDDSYVYLIVDDVMATNYAILRFTK